MRPEISPYGHTYMHTPNMQSLADDGYTMRRMFVQMALCAPSRTVMLTGRRPDRSHVWNIGPFFRDTVGADWVTLPQYFKEKGYVTAGAGKIFHPLQPSGYVEVNGTVCRNGDDCKQATLSPTAKPLPLSGLLNPRALNPRADPKSWSLPYQQGTDNAAGCVGRCYSNKGIEGPLTVRHDVICQR